MHDESWCEQMSDIGRLQVAIESVADMASGPRPDVARRAEALAERVGSGRFHVALAGDFKRGKSTVLNALVGEDLLPSGVVPVTAIGTEVRFGRGPIVVVGTDGSERPLGAGETLADYVTEAGNPGNIRNVRRVVVQRPAPLLASGLVLVDTPGLGSVHGHNDDEARRQLDHADGAIVVLSADSPLSERERAVVATVAARQARLFIVLNKVDHLTAGERDEVMGFVRQALGPVIGREPKIWCVSARAALWAKRDGRPPSPEAGDFVDLEGALAHFVDEELAAARLQSARVGLTALLGQLDDERAVEAAAADLDDERLASAVADLRAAVAGVRQAVHDDRILLRREVDELAEQVAADFQRAAVEVTGRWSEHAEQVEQVVDTTARRRVMAALDATVEQLVASSFEPARQRELALVADRWQQLTAGARARAESRLNALRATAASLFDVSLAPVELPELAAGRHGFSYQFTYVEGSASFAVDIARMVLPARWLRRRLLRRARARFADEIDKHAGRARADLADRLQQAQARFESNLAEHLSDAIDAIVGAAERGETLRRETAADRERRQRADDEIRRLLGSALAFG